MNDSDEDETDRLLWRLRRITGELPDAVTLLENASDHLGRYLHAMIESAHMAGIDGKLLAARKLPESPEQTALLDSLWDEWMQQREELRAALRDVDRFAFFPDCTLYERTQLLNSNFSAETICRFAMERQSCRVYMERALTEGRLLQTTRRELVLLAHAVRTWSMPDEPNAEFVRFSPYVLGNVARLLHEVDRAEDACWDARKQLVRCLRQWNAPWDVVRCVCRWVRRLTRPWHWICRKNVVAGGVAAYSAGIAAAI